eukprot:scaffold253754_cov14-Tisochrysis_lutea.AAC.1
MKVESPYPLARAAKSNAKAFYQILPGVLKAWKNLSLVDTDHRSRMASSQTYRIKWGDLQPD